MPIPTIPPVWRLACRWLLATVLCSLAAGCRQTHWAAPRVAPAVIEDAPRGSCASPAERRAADYASSLYSRAAEHDRYGDPGAVDLYYLAASASWSVLNEKCSTPGVAREVAAVYHQSVAQFLETARLQRRITPEGICVRLDGAPALVSIEPRGFAWRQGAFQELYTVGCYESRTVSRPHRRPGWGVPVVVRQRCPTLDEPPTPRTFSGSTFAATALLRPAAGQAPLHPAACSAGMVLELYEPHAQGAISDDEAPVALAADLSAPFVLREALEGPPERPLEQFRRPNLDAAQQGLRMLEPYQPGKIPLVLVHGLLSSPWTWVELANDLRADPWFVDHYQIWTFHYDTGRPFIRSAEQLRVALYEARENLDPCGRDPALAEMVIVGHSLGGLVAKLQVIQSGQALWQTAARVPLDSLHADPATRAELASLFFFEPLPFVRRVVFIATPHDGSAWAARLPGRLGSLLYRRDDDTRARHARLVADNRGAFTREMQERIPTSIDLLNPQSELLAAIRRQPIAPGVVVHSVIGTGGVTIGEPSDGIVKISSARLAEAVSELYVPVTHEQTHRDRQTTCEVQRVLRAHAAALEARFAQRPRQAGRKAGR